MRPKDAPKTQDFSERFSTKKPFAASIASCQNFTFDSTQNFNGTFRIKSHRAPKRNNLDRTIDKNYKSAVINKKSEQKKNQATSSTKISNPATEAITKIDTKTSKEPDNKKSPKGKRQAWKTDKQNRSIKKPNNKYQGNTKVDDQTNNEINTATAQQELNSNNNKQENNAQTNKLTKKKLAEPKVPNKNNKTKNNTQKKNPQSPAIEENNNKSNRSVRSCTTNSKKQTADKSNVTLNETMNRTLRSRKLNVSTTADKNNTTARHKDIKKVAVVRLNDVSYTLPKKTVTKVTNSSLLNLEESDVSFSLTPMQTRSASRNNTLNSTPLRRNSSKVKELPSSNIISNRKRLPNKRYVY